MWLFVRLQFIFHLFHLLFVPFSFFLLLLLDVYLYLIPFYLLIGLLALFAALLPALLECKEYFFSLVSDNFLPSIHHCSAQDRRRIFCRSPECSLCSFLSALRTPPALTSLHSQLCLCNSGRLPSPAWALSSFLYHSLEILQATTVLNLFVSHLLGNTILHFLIIQWLQNCFFTHFVQFLSLFQVGGKIQFLLPHHRQNQKFPGNFQILRTKP